MSTQSPREFWIVDDSRIYPNPVRQQAYTNPPDVLFPLIHVIEKSAYDKLLEEVKALRQNQVRHVYD